MRTAAAAALAEEEERTPITPCRTCRSAVGRTPPSVAPQIHLTGKTCSTKQLLLSQLEDETNGVPPLLTQVWNMAVGAPTAVVAPKTFVCDWAQAKECTFMHLAPLPCQHEGCEVLIHRICQSEWERREGHADVVARYCCHHHQDYKYWTAPEKQPSPDNVTPSRKKKAGGGHSIEEVCPNASPANSSITGMGGGMF